MMNDLQLRLSPKKAGTSSAPHPPIGRLLVNRGKIAPQDLQHALKLQKHVDAPLGEIMISEGLVEKKDVLSALATQAKTEGADLEIQPPAPEMAETLPVELCLQYGVVPWRSDQRALYVATSSPAQFTALLANAGVSPLPLLPVIVDEAQIQAHQSRLYGTELARRAAVRVPLAESCRGWDQQGLKRTIWAGAALFLMIAALVFAPFWAITVLSLFAVTSLLMTSAMKAAALVSHFVPVREKSTQHHNSFRMPRVSILVPLLKEREIAGQLIARLSQLTYPKSLLNVVLVLEEGDTLTRETIASTSLPDWMSVVEVPEGGGLTTKPRALNYAMNFCRGSIIGVWDAEDWPDSDQIEKVVSRFQTAPDDVVCLQGVLDYYNSRSSWLARCFTIEYAVWWRIVMPGIARLGLVVPLGGTTLFFRRDVLEELGGWDAHNVTEDADLGVRLARHGYKTELLPTVTREEATSRAWPWVRQRSRWLKGFLVTYFVHMRSPWTLIKDLGFWRFMGLQTIFLAAVSQFASAPLLWSFWLTLVGDSHPVVVILGSQATWVLAGLFVATEILSLTLGLVATSQRERRHLIPYLPTMMFYFGLGAIASYKAIWELVRAPFFWDKTQHGVTLQTDPVPVATTPSAPSSSID